MAGAGVILLFFGGMIGLMLVFMLYLQLGLGYSAAARRPDARAVVARHGRRGAASRARCWRRASAGT